MVPPFASLILDVADQIATLTINRPDKLNALNRAVIDEIGQAFTHLATRDDVRVVILTGAGRAFVAGADIGEIAEAAGTTAGLQEVAAHGSAVFTRIERFAKPVIAAVNGFALGGGFELALACHVRVAGTHAKFGLPEARLGLIPGYGGTQRLPRLIGQARALQMILTGDQVDAETAARYGIVHEVVAQDRLAEAARSLAKAMLKNGPLALAHAIAAVTGGAGLPLEAALALEAEHFGVVGRTADMREGTAAFLEKRAPTFRGA